MKKTTLLCSLLAISYSAFAQKYDAAKEHPRQKTTFQTSSKWIPQIDVRSDMAIVYGTNDHKGETFEQRVQSWRGKGYQTAFMTGIAWGMTAGLATATLWMLYRTVKAR